MSQPDGRYLLVTGSPSQDFCMWDPILPARRALLAILGDAAWHKFLVYVDGDHAVAARMLSFC